MKELAVDWVAGVLTLVAMELIRRRRWEGWAVTLFNQVVWLALIVYRELWGLLPLTALLTVQAAIAMRKWRNE